MTFTKNWKSIGAAALALATISSVSVMAFAQEAKLVPLKKIVLSQSTAPVGSTKTSLDSDGVLSVDMTAISTPTGSVPATVMTEATVGVRPADEAAAGIDFRTNKSTGKDEISTDGGKTWTIYDGKAIACTPATVGVKPSK